MNKSSKEWNPNASVRSMGSSSAEGVTRAELYYWPSICVLLSLGLANLYFAKLDGFIGSTFALLSVLFTMEWILLHSEKLTRAERSFYDETNILATSKNFEFNLGPVLDDTTPGGQQCCGPYPKASNGLIANLFKDEREEELQRFYREHYGQVFTTAKRVDAEYKASENAPKKN